jgi:pyridoxal phosphate enzyme (YggS family)
MAKNPASTTSSIANNICEIKALLEEIRINSHQSANHIKLLAVSKGQPIEKMLAAWQAGIKCFGENYLQEAMDKMRMLDIDPEWHFIGPVQANKTREIAAHFSWVHTVERIRIASRLSAGRADNATPLNICIQVNIDREPSKSGVDPDETLELANAIAALPNLRLRGLMVLPKPQTDFDRQRDAFRRTAQLLDDLKNSSPQLRSLDTLSMGMSRDMPAAVAEGATIVRVGTGIFGPRDQTLTN